MAVATVLGLYMKILEFQSGDVRYILLYQKSSSSGPNGLLEVLACAIQGPAVLGTHTHQLANYVYDNVFFIHEIFFCDNQIKKEKKTQFVLFSCIIFTHFLLSYHSGTQI